MRHPLQALPEGQRVQVFLLSLALTGTLAAVLNWTLMGERYGIVALELAGNEQKAREIVDSWTTSGVRDRAFINVHLDFAFLVAYSTTIASACIWAVGVLHARGWPGTVAGVMLAWGQWLAALLDAWENVALLKMLRGPVTRPWPRIAFWSATLKFFLVAVGLAYTAAGVVAWASKRGC
jgi:hypothetical protein